MDIQTLAEAYRSDPTKYFSPNHMHHRVELYSPGFQLLGIVSEGFRRDANDELGIGIVYHDFTRSYPIFICESWVKHRTSDENAGKRSQTMTLRWRRI